MVPGARSSGSRYTWAREQITGEDSDLAQIPAPGGDSSMKWDFWHVVLALIIAIIGAVVIWSVLSFVVGLLVHIVTIVIVIALVLGGIYLIYKLLVSRV